MADLEEALRATLDRQAGAVDAAPPRSLADRARARRRRRVGTFGVAAMTLVAVATASLLADGQREQEVAIEPGPSPTTVVVTGEPASGLMAVVGRRVLDLSVSPARVIANLPAEVSESNQPVRTRHGIVVQAGPDLLLVDENGGATRTIAADVDGFAVDRAGERVAWAVDDRGLSAVLYETTFDTLSTPVKHDVDVFARVVGYAGDWVVLSTGDGGDAAAAIWHPADQSFVRLQGPEQFYGSAAAADAGIARAILNQGDGTCPVVVEIGAEVVPTGSVLPCGDAVRGAAFSLDSRRIALVTGYRQSRLQVFEDGREVLALEDVGPTSPLWSGDDLYAVARGQDGWLLQRCSVAAGCAVAWELPGGPTAALVQTVTVTTPETTGYDQPSPPRSTPTPPTEFVAVTTDGRLVVVNTATGREVRQLAAEGNPTEPPPDEGPGPNVIDDVALSPDGRTVWYSTCCEPAGGNLYRVPLDGSSPPQRIASGYSPTVSLDGRYVAITTIFGATIVDHVGDNSRIWSDPASQGGYQEVAWSLDGSTMAVRTGRERGGLVILDPTTFGRGEADESGEGTGDPRPVLGDAWSQPAFDRTGRLLVAEHVRDANRWVARYVDVATGSVVAQEAFEYGGRPLAQDFDPTGEWLIVTEEVDAGAGTVGWQNPDGRRTEVPGRFRVASW
jgi:hypothetical protein